MKLFLDDYRRVGEGYKQVWTYLQCIKALDDSRDDLTFISLDYDLGHGVKSGFDVLVYMNENNIKPAHINIHSDHSEGVPKMREYVGLNFKDSAITFNKV